MAEKTLLVEIEKEQQTRIKQEFLERKQESKQEVATEKEVHVFSANAFPKQEVEELQEEKQEEVVQMSENIESSIIEKPNYDFIEELSEEQRAKVFKIEKGAELADSKPKSHRNLFKTIIFSVLFAIFGIWGIVNVSTIDTVGSQIAEVTTEYNTNLIKYLNNLHNLDATNSNNMENLFETIPNEEGSPNTIETQSNLFDRICDFIAGLFGG